jgi:branched-chain amino acid transport system substrate-binding protein
MKRRSFIQASSAGLVASVAGPLALPARAQAGSPFKIGLILPMTGPFASTGRQAMAAVNLYLAQIGGAVAGRKVEFVLKDDAGVADTTRRIASEMLTSDKVHVLAGFGLTPCAMAVGPIATQGKTPAVCMAAATSAITESSPFMVRTSYALPQTAVTMGNWAVKSGMKKFMTLVTDYGPGIDAERFFVSAATAAGATVQGSVRVPLRGSDFAPFLQRVRDSNPEALYVFLPSGPATGFMKQFAERGLSQAGIKLIGDGGMTDDDLLQEIGDVALGLVTTHHYSAAHPTAVARKFLSAFQAANKDMRPNFMAVGAYDGMRVICDALKATDAKGDGPALLEAMKLASFESPRGPFKIDPETRDVIHDIYVRKVERVNGQLFNVEFYTEKAVKDPGKGK